MSKSRLEAHSSIPVNPGDRVYRPPQRNPTTPAPQPSPAPAPQPAPAPSKPTK